MTNSIKGFVGSQGLGLLTNLPTALGISSIEGIVSGISDTMERELDLGFLADQLGAPLGFLQQLRAVASENSVGADQFTGAMERMNQVLGQARMGSEEAIETFERLGISVDDIRNQNFQTIFMRAARGLDGMSDRATRARLAMELFGRGGAANMLRFVDDLERAVADMQNRGIGEGAEEALRRIDELDQAIDRMSTRWSEFWRRWTARMAPAVTQLIGATETAFTDPLGISEAMHALAGITAVEPPATWMQSALSGALDGLAQQLGAMSNQGTPGFGSGLAAIEGQFHGILGRVIAGFEEMNRAQLEAAQLIAANRTPFEMWQESLAQADRLLQARQLTEEQYNRVVGNALDRATQGLMDTPDIGSLESGSAEVAAILANANNPQMNVMESMLAAHNAQVANTNRMAELLTRIEANTGRQVDAAETLSQQVPIL